MAGREMITESCKAIPLEAEARLFWWLRATIAWETLRSMLLGARLRLTLVALLSLVFWGSLYGLFVEGFTFLDSIHAEVISLLFNAFFSSLMIMLVFSTGILLYGSMYCSREARLLLTLPARPEARFIVCHSGLEPAGTSLLETSRSCQRLSMPTAPLPHFCTVPPPAPAGHLLWSGSEA